MSDPFIAEIVMFGGNFAPRQWAYCDGQLLAISQNSALYSLLGTTYGGDGRTTFGLPDLRGRVPVGPRNGPGLSSYRLGQRGGTESSTLSTNNLPAHNHAATAQLNCVAGPGNTNVAAANYPSKDLGVSSATYHSGPSDSQMASGAVAVTTANTGGGTSFENRQPYLAINFIIALQGVFPSRN